MGTIYLNLLLVDSYLVHPELPICRVTEYLARARKAWSPGEYEGSHAGYRREQN